MEVVQLLIPADGVHVGVEPLSGVELIALQSQALPLGQGVDHLGGVLHPVDLKGDGALHPVQVIVEAGGGGDEQGGRHPVQAQGTGEAVLEQTLEQADGLLGLIEAEEGAVSLGNDGFSHVEYSF